MSIRQVKLLALALIVACAAGAIATAAAQAVVVEGPIVQVEREGLVSGATQEVTAAGKTAFVFKVSSVKIRVECKAVKVKSGATLVGAELTSGAKGKETLEFSECKGGGEGESLKECEPEGGKVTSAALADTLGFATETRTGALLVLLTPESGTTLASLKFSGSGCALKTATVTGNLIAAVYSGGSAVEVGKNEVEAVKQELRLSASEKTIYTEKEGTLTLTKGSLKIDEAASTLEGQATLELTTAQPWGPFSQIDAFSGYTFGPPSVTFSKVGETREFTLDDIGGEELELLHPKVVGGEASHYEITDTHLCAAKTLVSLGHCELTIKMISSGGSALLEGEVRFAGLFSRKFAAKALVP
jgi:hypothetical protein